jgi:hypothetical protein
VPGDTKKNHTDRDVELVLYKKELKEEFWPRLLKEKGKVHFLRTDFDKVSVNEAQLCRIHTNITKVGR